MVHSTRPFLPALVLALGAALAIGQARGPAGAGECESGAGQPAGVVERTADGEPKGLHRFHRWTPKVTQGAQPEGEIAFKNMAALGITTVISVDGALPDLKAAAKYGLRYIHLPIGYDGVPRDMALKMAAAVQRSKGGVYFHCHHGKHRGPAGCMAARVGLGEVSHDEAVAGMKASRTSPKYAGLYRDIKGLPRFTAEELASVKEADLPSSVKPDGARAAMVDVSHRFEALKAAKAQAYVKVPDHPDIDPAHEARMLWELFREMQRLDESKEAGEGYMASLKTSETHATALEAAIRAKDIAAADKAFKGVAMACNACHVAHRN